MEASETAYRLTRKGCLCVGLMPTYRGAKLTRAVNRIIEHGPKDEFERAAVIAANNSHFSGPKFPTAIKLDSRSTPAGGRDE